MALVQNEKVTKTRTKGARRSSLVGRIPFHEPFLGDRHPTKEVLDTAQPASSAPLLSQNGHVSQVASNGVSHRKFRNAYEACNFIVTWNGEDVPELLDAIRCARESQDRFIQDKLIEYILNIPFRNPRPADIPAFVGKPIWAVDKHGRVLVGMPGSETIVDVESLRSQLHSAH